MTARPGFCLGDYVFKDAEVVDYAAPYGVFSVAHRLDPAMDAFLIPGGFGTRQETYNANLHAYIRDLPDNTLLTSLCAGSWTHAQMGLLDGHAATNREEPDRLVASNMGQVPIDRLAELAPKTRISRSRVVDAGRIITVGGIASGKEMSFYLLERAGCERDFVREVSRVMEYASAYDIYEQDRDVL